MLTIIGYYYYYYIIINIIIIMSSSSTSSSKIVPLWFTEWHQGTGATSSENEKLQQFLSLPPWVSVEA